MKAKAISEDSGETTRSEGPRSVLRVMEILNALAATPKGLTLARLSQDLKTPKTSLLNLLRSLESGHYLQHIDGAYSLGAQAIKLGQRISLAAPFPKSAKPTLSWLAQETKETTILGVLSDSKQRVLYLETIESQHELRYIVLPGDERPLYSSGIGQILLAFATQDFLKSYLKTTKFEKFTDYTLSSERLLEHLATVRREGYAINLSGRLDGILGVSVPVVNEAGAVFAGISVGAPIVRLEPKKSQVIAQSLKAGEEISRIVGYKGVYPPPSGS